MIIGIKEAIDKFYNNPSFDLIYSEAMANALDAGASLFKIEIKTKSFEDVNSLEIAIEDDGVGFNDNNFDKFCHLLKKEDDHHKGLGRLVYLKYFQNVHIESVFSKNQKRIFDFNNDFVDSCESIPLEKEEENCTKLLFTRFCNDRLKSYDNITPLKIKNGLVKQFLPRLYVLKQQQKDFCLSVTLSTEEENRSKGFYSDTVTMSLNDLPSLQEQIIRDPGLDLFETEFKLLYLVETNNYTDKPITAICVDGRAVELSILNDTSIPAGTNAVFLLQSGFFDSKVNDSRQGLALSPQDQETIERIFADNISEILNSNVPSIRERNQETKKRLFSHFPHLAGYFNSNSIGLIDEDKSIHRAQEAFFKEQKEILGATQLTDDQYKRSLDQLARVLTEYILYRNLIIDKLGKMRQEHPEEQIHDLIVPMHREFSSETCIEDIYCNNAWLLDDKYMSYRFVLSDKNIKDLLEKICDEQELQSDDLRPDIAFVFSDDIEKVEHPIDVVVVELKKKGLGYLDNIRVLEQIKQRARRLVSLYPTKIQRMWFFGIVEFDKELSLEMKEGRWVKLYSTDEVFYKEIPAIPVDSDLNPISETPIPVSVTLMSYNALWQDAKKRNETFLTILKAGIQQSVPEEE